MELTEAHLRAVRLAGACGEALRRYRAGMPLHQVSMAHLLWVEEYAPEAAAEYDGALPLWAIGSPGSSYRSGYGYGSGYGSGDGYGDGSGDGSGYGDGDGYGYEDLAAAGGRELEAQDD